MRKWLIYYMISLTALFFIFRGWYVYDFVSESVQAQQRSNNKIRNYPMFEIAVDSHSSLFGYNINRVDLRRWKEEAPGSIVRVQKELYFTIVLLSILLSVIFHLLYWRYQVWMKAYNSPTDSQ